MKTLGFSSYDPSSSRRAEAFSSDMAFNIEVLSIGGDFDAQIQETAQLLNGVQSEFRFSLPPVRLRRYALTFSKSDYTTHDFFKCLREYRCTAKGDRRYLIGVVDAPLRSKTTGNLFGSHEAENGVAVFTLRDHKRYLESTQLYLCYYFIRYALSFVCPALKNHTETRGCFFDKKRYKPDIQQSVDSATFCEKCRESLWETFNEEIISAIAKMTAVMKAIRAASEESLQAASLKGQVDTAIMTVREDEFEAMLDRFPSWRHVKGNTTDYSYCRVVTKRSEELRVIVARCPEQGHSAAQALASNIIYDLGARWILLVGIAGAFPASEYTLGDVLISQRMHDFAVSAAIEGAPPEFQDMGGPMSIDVERLVTQLGARKSDLGPWSSKEFLGHEKPQERIPAKINATAFYGSSKWRKQVLKSLNAHFPKKGPPRDPTFSAATLITANTLLKDTKLATLWRRTARHASGVEMELGGVCKAARYGQDGQTRVMAIRGISDIVGYKRSPEWTGYACHSAAAFAHALITSGIIRRQE